MVRISKKRKKTHPRKKSKKRVLAKSSKSKSRKQPKKKARDRVNKYPGLKKNLFSKIKQEFHDIDYADKLSPEDKDWLSRFMEEDLGARMNHPGKPIYKKKQDKLDAYKRNNKRNWDIHSINKATGGLVETDTNKLLDAIQNLDTTNPEDSIIDAIDLKKLTEKS